MQTILIEKNLIAQHEIDKCVSAFNTIVNGPGQERKIVLKGLVELENFNILLIGYLILFFIKLDGLEIVIDLPFNPPGSNDKLESQLKQAGTYAYLMTGKSVFAIIFGQGNNKSEVHFNLGEAPVFPERWYVFSKDFFPILIITDDYSRIESYFETGLTEQATASLHKLPRKIKWVKESSELRNSCSKHFRETSTPSNRKSSLVNLAKTAFYNALDEAKILPFFFEDAYDLADFDNANRIQAGNLVNKKAYEYYERVKPIFTELSQKSLIYHFLFSTILSTDLLVDKEAGKNVLNDITKEGFVSKLLQLWNFTKDLIVGLRELAKNIHEHANPALGAITLRIFERSKWSELQVYDHQSANVYQQFTTHLLSLNGRQNFALMDINVIDIGNTGVVSTLLQNSIALEKKSEANSRLKELLQEDIELLVQKKVRFTDLLNPDGRQLNQQSKRNIAHFGLLIFSKLIQTNDGLVIASTLDVNDKEREQTIFPKQLATGLQTISSGTNYHIVLPIRRAEVYKTILPHPISLPSELSARDIKGIEELLNFEVMTVKAAAATDVDEQLKYVLCLDMPDQLLRTRDDEESLWKKVQTELSPVIPKLDRSRCLICLNLNQVKINESQLFRFLGNWELYLPTLTLAVTNFENDTYQKLLSLNGDYHKMNPRLDYWNANMAILMYSFILVGKERFYFADVLWGKNREDFINLNWIINLTNFNSTVLLNKERLKTEVLKHRRKIYTNTDIAFYNDNTLLPFDLIFDGSKPTTLFEHNALVLLQNEIKF